MKIVNVSKTYKLKSGEVKALDGITLDLPDRGMIFILGRSGSGKSTLLNLLSGLDSADEGGKIEVGGKNICACSERERDGYRNSRCGFIFQEYNLIPELSVKENVALSRQLQDEKDNDEAVKEALGKVELQGYENRRVTELSGGQKQRAAIARAVVKNPDVVFADEPTGALDEATGESVFTLLKELSRERLVLVVSHDREFARKYADRVIELADGKIVGDSDKDYTADEKSAPPFKKPKLPLKAAAKIGCANFRFHPMRLVATLLLSVIAFTFLGVTVASAANVYENIVYDAMLSDGVTYSAVRKYYNSDGTNVPIKQSEKETLIDRSLLSFGAVAAESGIELENYGDTVYDGALPWAFAEMTAKQAEACGFSILGRLPREQNELCLTAFSAEILNRLQYKKTNDADIIGESLLADGRSYAVVGIVDTRFDGKAFEALKSERTGTDALAENYAATVASSVHALMFVKDVSEYFSGKITLGRCRLTPDNAPDIAISRITRQTAGGEFYRFDESDETDGNYIAAGELTTLMHGVFCRIERDGKLYRNFGDLFFDLCAGDFSGENMAAVYERHKAEYGFPESFACTITDSGYELFYEASINGIATEETNGTFVADESLYGKIYDKLGGEFDTVIVKNSPAVKPFIAGVEQLKLDNYTAKKAESNRGTIDGIRRAAASLAAIFAAFAALLLLNFLLVSFTDKFRTLGILKANGCNSGGLLKVFACEAIVIAAAVSVVAGALTVVCGGLLNAYFGVAFFGSYFIALPTLFTAVLAVAAAGCLLPTVRIMRMTPVSVIAEND